MNAVRHGSLHVFVAQPSGAVSGVQRYGLHSETDLRCVDTTVCQVGGGSSPDTSFLADGRSAMPYAVKLNILVRAGEIVHPFV